MRIENSAMTRGGLIPLGATLAVGLVSFGLARANNLTIPEIGPGGCVALCDGATSIPVLPDIPTDVPSTEVLIPDVTAPPTDIVAAPLPSGSTELVPVPSFDGERGFEAFKDDFQIIGALQSCAPSDLANFGDVSDPIVRQKGLLRFLDAGAWMLVERGSLEGAAAEYAKAADIAAQDPELRDSLKTSIEARYDDAERTGKELRVLEVLARSLVALDPDDAAAQANLETLRAKIASTSQEGSGPDVPASSEDSPGVIDPNDVAGAFKPAGEARPLEVSAEYEGGESELAGRQPSEPPAKGPSAWRGVRDQLTEQEKADWQAKNSEFLREASAPFDDVRGDEIAARVLWEWPTYEEDVKSDTYEHFQGTRSFLWKRAEGFGISNLRPANLLAKTHAAERLANDKNIPNDIKNLELEAMRDEDRYRELLYEDNRFSLFVLGQTMQVLRERFKEEGYGDVPYDFVHQAMERNAYSKEELGRAAAEVVEAWNSQNLGAVTEAPSP